MSTAKLFVSRADIITLAINTIDSKSPPTRIISFVHEQEASELKSSLEQQIESTRESYQRQLSSLKEDIADREKQLRNHEQKYLEEQQKQSRLKLVVRWQVGPVLWN